MQSFTNHVSASMEMSFVVLHILLLCLLKRGPRICKLVIGGDTNSSFQGHFILFLGPAQKLLVATPIRSPEQLEA